jgi:hypothetical protein
MPTMKLPTLNDRYNWFVDYTDAQIVVMKLKYACDNYSMIGIDVCHTF